MIRCRQKYEWPDFSPLVNLGKEMNFWGDNSVLFTGNNICGEVKSNGL